MIEDCGIVDLYLYPIETFALELVYLIPEENIHDRERVYTWSGLMEQTEALWERGET